MVVVAASGGVGVGMAGGPASAEQEQAGLISLKQAPGAEEPGSGGAQRRRSRVAVALALALVALALALVALLGAGLLAGLWSGARRASGDEKLELLVAAATVDDAVATVDDVAPALAGEDELNAEAEKGQEQELDGPELKPEPAQVHEFPATRPRMELEPGRGSVPKLCVDKFGVPAQEIINDPAQFNPRWPPQEPGPNTTVFVYEAAEVNWLKQMQLTCPEANLRKMLEFGLGYKHSGDLKTALALLEGNGARSFIESGRRTYDPLAADVIVVPLLLSMMHPRFLKGCNSTTYLSWTETAGRYLEAQPHYHATSHKHFFVADRGSIFTGNINMRNMGNMHHLLAAAMRRGVVATFEGRKTDISRCTVVPPYVPVQCVGPTAKPNDLPRNASLRDAWFLGGSYSERPIEFHLRAQMDWRSGKRGRIGLCNAVHQFDKRSGAFSTCCAVPGAYRAVHGKKGARKQGPPLSGHIFDRRCSSGDMAACNCDRTSSSWCNEIRQARFLILAPGDSPLSTRAYDAMRYGTLLAVFKRHGYNKHCGWWCGSEDYVHYMPRRVPWSYIIVEMESGPSHSVNAESMVDGFFAAANLSVPELLCRRKLVNDYAAVTDWLAYDGVPVVQWMLESARRDCIEPKAAASTNIG